MNGQQKSILIVGNFISARRGIRCVCEDLAEHMAASGLHVITTSKYSSRLFRLLDMLVTIWRKRRCYAIAHVDVYSGRAFALAEAACGALHLLGKPFILTLHGGNLPRFASHHSERVRRLLQSARAVTAPSPFLAERLSHLHKNIRVVPNPINLSAYPFRPRKSASPRIVWLRAFQVIYNPMLASQVISILVKSWPDVHLTMIGPDKGDGSKKSTLELATRLNVTGHITVRGSAPKRDIPALLQGGDIFINTTDVDNTPVSVLEAMACGLCVVSTNVGGLSCLLAHGMDALLVAPKNAEAMAAAVSTILTDAQLAESLSRNGRAKVEQFDWQNVTPMWRDLFDLGSRPS